MDFSIMICKERNLKKLLLKKKQEDLMQNNKEP